MGGGTFLSLLSQTIHLFSINNSTVLPKHSFNKQYLYSWQTIQLYCQNAQQCLTYPLVFQCAINKAHSSTRMPLHRPNSPFVQIFVSLVNGSEEASSFICALNWNWGWSKRLAVNIWSLLPRKTKVTSQKISRNKMKIPFWQCRLAHPVETKYRRSYKGLFWGLQLEVWPEWEFRTGGTGLLL